MLVNVAGSADFLCTVGQQLAWLGAVCRFSEGGIQYCDTNFACMGTDLRSGVSCFHIGYELVPLEDDEMELCWHSLIEDSVIASAFPIVERSARDKGLQIFIEIMAALGGISIAVDFGLGYVLKGETVAFIPVERHNDHVQWHLLHDNGKSIGYEWLEKQQLKVLDCQILDSDSINKTTCFLEWVSKVLNRAGKYCVK